VEKSVQKDPSLFGHEFKKKIKKLSKKELDSSVVVVIKEEREKKDVK